MQVVVGPVVNVGGQLLDTVQSFESLLHAPSPKAQSPAADSRATLPKHQILIGDLHAAERCHARVARSRRALELPMNAKACDSWAD